MAMDISYNPTPSATPQVLCLINIQIKAIQINRPAAAWNPEAHSSRLRTNRHVMPLRRQLTSAPETQAHAQKCSPSVPSNHACGVRHNLSSVFHLDSKKVFYSRGIKIRSRTAANTARNTVVVWIAFVWTLQFSTQFMCSKVPESLGSTKCNKTGMILSLLEWE